jgi:hypothetical protein
MKTMGLGWLPVRQAKRTFASYRIKAIRDYLIALDSHLRHQSSRRSETVFVFTDESYVNANHCLKNSYFPHFSISDSCTHDSKLESNKDSNLESDLTQGTGSSEPGLYLKSGRGRRLIILHAMTKYGPLVQCDQGHPIDDLDWKKDCCHLKTKARDDGKVTCETLWVAQSHTGDYHDNMNSEMFMLWVQNKLVPCFETLFPKKQMILVSDNAPYHHSREIGSLGSLTKSDVMFLMDNYNIPYVDLPISNSAREDLRDSCDHPDHPDVQDKGDHIRVSFDLMEQTQRAISTKPRVASLQEL